MTSITILIIGIVTGFSLAQAVGTSFPDVKESDWFYEDVMNMVDWGVIRGNTDGTFAPDRNVNRAELSAMWNRYDKHVKDEHLPIYDFLDLYIKKEIEENVVTMDYPVRYRVNMEHLTNEIQIKITRMLEIGGIDTDVANFLKEETEKHADGVLFNINSKYNNILENWTIKVVMD